MFDPIALAETAVSTYLATGQQARVPDDLPDEWKRPGAVFVCVKKNGQLRGCIGTYAPTRASLAEEVIHNAVNSATDDPRFPAVSKDELAGLEFSVDVLEPPEQIYTVDDLDTRIYGVIVRAGARVGLLLPDIQGVDTIEQQVAIARRKAGISPVEAVELFRFKIRRYENAHGVEKNLPVGELVDDSLS